MSFELEEIKNLILEQSKKIDEIKFAIYGNREAGIRGIAKLVKDHEDYISSDKKQKWYFAGALFVFVSALTAFWKKVFGE